MRSTSVFNHLGRKFLDPKYDYQEEDKKCAEEYQKEQERLNGGGKIKLENANKNNNALEISLFLVFLKYSKYNK